MKSEWTWPVASLVIGGSATGALPRVGPLRAMGLAIFSRIFKSKPVFPPSIRQDLVDTIRARLHATTPGSVVCVMGPKGVGKSCIVFNSVINKQYGVLRVDLKAGMNSTTIKSTVHRAIANRWSSLTMVDNLPSAKRVVSWCNRFGLRPTVVLQIPERKVDSLPIQDISQAARSLSEMGCKVLIEASDNALTLTQIEGIRSDIVFVEDMSRERLESIPEFQEMFSRLQRVGMMDVVYYILGGRPGYYDKLIRVCKAVDDENLNAEVYKILEYEIADNISIRNESTLDLKNVFEKLKDKSWVAKGETQLPHPCKSLRVGVMRGEGRVLRPSTTCMARVLQHQWQKPPTLQELKELSSKPSN
jgi:hypothetical protein